MARMGDCRSLGPGSIPGYAAGCILNLPGLVYIEGSVALTVERGLEEPCVAGSNPAASTQRRCGLTAMMGDCLSPDSGSTPGFAARYIL